MVGKAAQTGSTSFTLLSQMMGASLLSCAFIVYKLGWILAILANVIPLIFVIFLYRYFVDLAHYTQASSFREMTEKILGKKVSLLVDICIIIFYFGAITAYIIISSSSIITFVLNVANYQLNSYLVKGVLAVVIIFPLCLLKSLKQLSKIASIAGISIFVTAFTIIVYFFMHVSEGVLCKWDGGQITYGIPMLPNVDGFTTVLYFLMYIPAIQGNYTCQTVVPTLIREMQGPSFFRKKIVFTSLVIAIVAAFCLYMSVGFGGAAMFGANIKDNILQAFKPCKWIWTDIVALIYAFVVIIAYPLVLYPIKRSLVQVAKKDPETKEGYRFSILISIIFIVLSMGLAMVLESILTIFGFFSALTGLVFNFVVPLIFFIKYPKIKKENIHLDKLEEGTAVVDPVVVGVISLMAPNIDENQVNRIRTFSNKMFGGVVDKVEKDSVGAKRTMSFLRQRALSISNSEDGNQKVRTQSFVRHNSNMSGKFSDLSSHQDGLLEVKQTYEDQKDKQEEEPKLVVAKDIIQELQAEEESTITVEEIKVEQYSGEVTKSRKVIGYTLIGLSSAICLVGIIMNAMDVVELFKSG